MPFVRSLRIIALRSLLASGVTAVSAQAAEPASTAPAAQQADVVPGANRQRAAELYDRAVRLYEQAKYAEAARAFYDADALSPSSDALASAMAAARLANDHLLVAQAAQRAIGREQLDAKLAGDARAALSEAEVHLARVDLQCRPTPCELSVESRPVTTGRQYLLPGTHLFVASYGSNPRRVEQQATLAAGSLYTITLAPPAEAAAVSGRDATRRAQPSPAAASKPYDDRPKRAAKPLPAWTFFSGAAVSALLGGVSIWSGIDALSDVDRFKSSRTSSDRATALAAIHRTDLLLAGTVLMAGATIFIGLDLVDFGNGKHTVGVAPGPSGAQLTWSGRL